MTESDAVQIEKLTVRLIELIEFREKLQNYLKERMDAVAPNLTALIGELVASKLISHSGGLTNLAKYPASTIQILGAEKALFRALKQKGGKTPKYGLIFNSTFIGRAGQKNKGRISRYLANKCAIASRMDSFYEGEHMSAKVGETLRSQMEERLQFLATGEKPRRNKDVMSEVLEELKQEGLYYGDKKRDEKAQSKKEKKDSKKKKAADTDDEDEESDEEPVKPKKTEKKKKSKKADSSDEEEEEEEKPKKKKKAKKSAADDDEEEETKKPKKKKKVQ